MRIDALATSSKTPALLALRGDLLDFTTAPGWGEVLSPAVRYRPGHWLLMDSGRIVGVQTDEPPAAFARCDRQGQLVMPGFIDTHVHSPQLEVIASYGTALLDWLAQHTYPAEATWVDREQALTGSRRFIDALLAHGTTSAVVFPTVHANSVDALFETAQARDMRLIAGKVLMDRNVPDDVRDDVAHAEGECRALIERWHGVERLAYAVTVRFAPSSSPEQLAMAGRLCRSNASLYAQTHLAESHAEVEWVQRLFPNARSYLDVYAQAGLLHERSVFAHGIWLDDTDRVALRDAGAQVAHCPSSNLFLGSGLFDWHASQSAGVNVSLATDVGAGTSLSIQRTFADAYKVQALRGERLTAWCALYAATRGAARALKLDGEIGHFDPGALADLCVWDWHAGAVAERRHAVARDLHSQVFGWMMLSDERNLQAAMVNGQWQFTRDLPGAA